jgi:hypothetical protein
MLKIEYDEWVFVVTGLDSNADFLELSVPFP